jgi:hypothetical protein
MILTAWLAVAGPALAADVALVPGDDWCAAINAASPGDTVNLAAGDYEGPCTISVSGEDDAPVTLAGDHAAIVYEGTQSNVIDVDASHVVLEGLSFGPTNADIDAIKIRSGTGIDIRECTFSGVGGISVSANSADTSDITIASSDFVDLQATGVYLGCHDGSCRSADFLIAGNRWDGVTSPDVGYAMETKLESYGAIRDNVVADAQGPAVEVYGSSDGNLTTVERNLLVGSRDAATLEIGGGPVLVRNNVVIGGDGAALLVYDYGGRGLVFGIVVIGNTAWGTSADAVSLQSWYSGRDLSFEDNAVGRDDGSPALPDAVSGVPMEGNLDCSGPGGCWIDAPSWDLWPSSDGPLVGAAVTTDPPLLDDWCGRTRPFPATVGALELGTGQEGAFSATSTQAGLCPPDAEDQDSASDDSDEAGVCGCATGGPPAGLGLLLCVSIVVHRRRRL